MSNPEIKKLKNNATLLTLPSRETKIASVLISFRVGSRYEPADKIGISHFLEHLMFDGTEKRPTARDVARDADQLGANFNAHTSDEYTTFYISASSDHLEKAIELLGDMISNSLLAEKEIIKEKNVIIEEIKMGEDMPAEHVHDLYDEAIYHGDPLERNVIGSRQSVNSISREDIVSFKNEFYVGENCYIGIGGNLERYPIEKIIRMLEENINLPAGKKTEIFPAKIASKNKNILIKDTAQTNILLGFLGPAYNSIDEFPLKILGIILGGNMSSRLFTKIREELKLAYDIRTAVSLATSAGTLVTQAGVASDKVDLALRSIINEYEKVKTDLEESEVDKAKRYMIGQAEIKLEGSFEQTYFSLRHYFTTGEIITLDQFVTKIKSVTFDQVKSVAEKYLLADKIVVAAIGPDEVNEKIIKALSARS
ncbi:MAG: pitrilysin family protein [Patescibacteria group bacterium]|jgi:predicted Zn-dependent peptidase